MRARIAADPSKRRAGIIASDPTRVVDHRTYDAARSQGRPIDHSTRALMEPLFGLDLSRVRIHDGPRAMESAREAGLLAYTTREDIVFGAAGPSGLDRSSRHVLAHELAHVAQQSMTGPPGTETAQEMDADRAADRVSSGSAARVSVAATPGSVQGYRKKIKGVDVEFGDVKLNAAAAVDALTHGNLLPSKDQAHIAVEKGKNHLGYDATYSSPEDPFRWLHLKDIVDKGVVDINGIGITASFDVKEFAMGKETIAKRNLISLGGSGITLPRLSVEKAIYPQKTVLIASSNAARDQVHYETGKKGRGLLGGNALAHELFGHLWLSMQGIPHGHSDPIAAPAPGSKTPGLQDPLGRTYSGTVNEYIKKFAGDSGKMLQSPTRFVGTQFVLDATQWMLKEGATHLSWRTIKGQQQATADNDFGKRWEILGQNYEVMLAGPQSSPAPMAQSAGGLIGWLVGWFNGLSQDKQAIFTSILNGLSWSIGTGRSTKLAEDLRNKLQAQPLPQPASPSPSTSPTKKAP